MKVPLLPYIARKVKVTSSVDLCWGHPSNPEYICVTFYTGHTVSLLVGGAHSTLTDPALVLDHLSCLYLGGQRVKTFTLPVIV